MPPTRLPSGSSATPRVLRVALGEPPASWRCGEPELGRLASWSGSALAVAILTEHALRAAPGAADTSPLVIAIGECVRRGVPTAARASISSRAPLTGLFTEGQVGSDLARRLASVADALVIEGRTELSGAVLHVAERGAELLSIPEVAGLSPALAHARIEARLGSCATLATGIAGERELPCASLAASASSEAGGGAPHFVGRGGLGAVLGRTGLKALAVSSRPAAQAPDSELIRALTRSPRLLQRSEGGTLELFEAFGARGELRRRNGGPSAEREVVEGLAREIRGARRGRSGCEGCPTPCGWEFDLGGATQRARFGASHALGVELGLARFEDALALLAACDEAGLDAKEIGAGLALFCEARGAWGRREELARWVAEAALGVGEGALLAQGSEPVARELGLEASARTVKGAAVRPGLDLAALLGQCVSARGADPLRSFPFLVADGSGRERLLELLAQSRAPWESLPEGAEDPFSPTAKGRLVWWHENLSAALDLCGFCAFSAGSLLADGVLDLDQLALRIAPAAIAADRDFASQPGPALLRAGEELVGAQRRLNRLWGWSPERDRPAWARATLEQPGLLDEYESLREARALGAAGPLTPSPERESSRETLCPTAPPAALGRVVLAGPALALARADGALALELELPASLRDVLERAANLHPELESAFLREARILPAVYRAGRRVEERAWVYAGDRLEVVLVVSGG
jgi:aldehyde:ferredoxin oxidoreductase